MAIIPGKIQWPVQVYGKFWTTIDCTWSIPGHEEGGAELESLRRSGVRLMLGTGEVPLELLHSLKIRCSLKCIP